MEDRIEALKSLPKGSKIHILGICGTGVGAVAVMLKELGFRLTGSDKAYYPPMDKVVRSVADKCFEGYSAENIKEAKPDFVIVGNSIRQDNEEMQAVDVPYASMPEAFGALLIGDTKCSIVVAGTHGKTTTTTAIAYLLEKNGLKPGYFIGGVPKDLDSQLKLGAGDFVVLEGDEYDSAWFAKWAKFQSYRPDILVITSLEFDHADIYRNLEEIEEQFRLVISKMKPEGLVLVCGDYKRLVEKAREWCKDVKLQTYGSSESNDFYIKDRSYKNGLQELTLSNGDEIETKLSGNYNALNMLATYVVAQQAGVKDYSVLKSFSGAKRRQEVLVESDKLVLIEDFAHHPTAVKEILCGLKELYPGWKLTAVFEPRSNTSRRAVFQNEYAEALAVADTCLIKKPLPLGYSKFSDDSGELNVEQICEQTGALIFDSNEEVLEILTSGLDQDKSVVVLMSNGDFGGLAGFLTEKLNS